MDIPVQTRFNLVVSDITKFIDSSDTNVLETAVGVIIRSVTDPVVAYPELVD